MLDTIQAKLPDPQVLRESTKEYIAEHNRQAAGAQGNHEVLRKRELKRRREVERVMNAIKSGASDDRASARLTAELNQLLKELEEIERDLNCNSAIIPNLDDAKVAARLAKEFAAIRAHFVAAGPDDNSNRTGVTIEFGESGPSADGATTIGSGALLRPMAANSQQTPNGAKANSGFFASTMLAIPGSAVGNGVYGSFGDAFLCDGGEVGCYDVTSGTNVVPLSATANSGQANLDFALGTNINVGQIVSGSANLPANATVSAVYQCWATQPLTGCGAKTNETLVTVSGNLTGNITSGTSLTFSGVLADGSNFNAIFSDAFTNWTNQIAVGTIKAGTLLNTGTVLDIQGFGEDSTNTTGVAYGDIKFDVQSNAHGATAGNINLIPAGAGCVKIAGICTGTAATQNTGTTGGNIPLLNGTNSWSGVQTFGAGDFALTGALNGDVATFGASSVLQDSGTLFSSLALKASPTFTGTVTLPDGTTAGASITLGANVTGNSKSLLNLNNVTGNGTNAFQLTNQNASATAPTFQPNKADTKAGIGADASGDVSIIADAAGAATEIARITSAGIILQSGVYKSGATSGVSCTGSPTASFASTNGIVTHC